MVALPPLTPEQQARIFSKIEPRPVTRESPIHQFISDMKQAGFAPPATMSHEKLYRFDEARGGKGKKNCWAVYHEFEGHNGSIFGVGSFGNWKTGEIHKWSSAKDGPTMSAEEREFYTRAMETTRLKHEAEQLAMQGEAAKRAFTIWAEAQPIESMESNTYLSRKQVMPLGVRQSKGAIVVPVSDGVEYTSLQFINPDGSKKFLSGGRIKGCWFRFEHTPQADHIIYITEGYATGASIHMATGCMVYVAFNAGNLYEVAAYVIKEHSDTRIVVCGDDDTETAGNPGRTKATQTAEALGVECIFPEECVDFNDYHVANGLVSLQEALQRKPRLYAPKPSSYTAFTEEMLNPPGIMGDIVNYYNATSGIYQPGFAVQAAIALVSVVCGRSFETNYDNRTALFLMNLGRSATGKEHSKGFIDKILESANQGHLIGGSGYTSKGAVFSALMAKPRHLTIIDEFSKYMNAAQNRNGNGNYQEANAVMMEAIGAPQGKLRVQAYSTMGLTKERKKDVENMRVVNPSLTLLAMSTQEDLFKTINISSIKDGFYNRFIFFISDVQRQPRVNKEPLPVPEVITTWIKNITGRRGSLPELADEAPVMHTLVMDTNATAMARELEEYKVARANELERFSLQDLPGRLTEMAQRLALCVALSDNPMATVVTGTHMAWASHWVKQNHIILTDKMKMGVSGSDFEARKLESLAFIRSRSEWGVSPQELITTKPFSTYDKRQRDEVISELTAAGLIDMRPRMTGKPGKPSMVYVAIDNN